MTIFICHVFLGERQSDLSRAADKTPPRKYLEAMEALLKWINHVEEVLLSEEFLITDVDILEDQLQKYKV